MPSHAAPLLGLLCLGAALWPVPAAAWGQHYLITAAALSLPEGGVSAEAEVAVEPLDALLLDQGAALSGLFDDYYTWLEARRDAGGSARFHRMAFDATQPTVASFLKAARLHPDTHFPLVQRLLPGEPGPESEVALPQVSPYLQDTPPFRATFVNTQPGDRVSVLGVLSTFSDEPDWQMDHSLWPFAEYGYGDLPYGTPEGTGSKAAFHMQFNHENFIVRAFASEMLDGMVLERLELFVRLARLAHATGHDYWGYRFAAWAMHYVQDVSQPYHAKAAPSAGTMWYIRYMISPAKGKMKAKTTQVLSNRHFLYEDYVALGLERSFTSEDPTARALAVALDAGGLEDVDRAEDAAALLSVVTDRASGHARAIDRAVGRSFPAHMTRDPSYVLESDPNYNGNMVLSSIQEGRGEALLQETSTDFRTTGCATRAVLRLTGAEGR